jgi:hypothetical protein
LAIRPTYFCNYGVHVGCVEHAKTNGRCVSHANVVARSAFPIDKHLGKSQEKMYQRSGTVPIFAQALRSENGTVPFTRSGCCGSTVVCFSLRLALVCGTHQGRAACFTHPTRFVNGAGQAQRSRQYDGPPRPSVATQSVPKARPDASPGWSGGRETTAAQPWRRIRSRSDSPNGTALTNGATSPFWIPDGLIFVNCSSCSAVPRETPHFPHSPVLQPPAIDFPRFSVLEDWQFVVAGARMFEKPHDFSENF